MRPLIAAAAALAAMSAPSARADAPEPSKPVDPARFSGRWYEFARLPNRHQKDCHAPTYDWARSGGDYTITLTCRAGSPNGKASVRRARARIKDARTNAKLDVSFVGGAVKVEYRILDHAPDYSWVLTGTAGGKYVWALSTSPNPTPAVRDAAVARARALGYAVSRFEYPQQG